ncbi:hypothetical protein NP493_136g05017 [Ridgeia piscesae]|uniref:Uncharacterized protein n=1 Tax=Ridgeia piscesae TaxID=27915 RepID=A0AAD9P5E0_RIDPI|nr:hypothetical protein NP493_136g05017 [Ridgeia piscesae]
MSISLDTDNWTESCYTSTLDRLNWINASLNCQRVYNGRLMMLKTPSTATRLVIDNPGTLYWIGLSSTQTPGVFRWEDGMPLKNDSLWLYGAPAPGSQKQCVYVKIQDDRERYSNEDCSTELPSICEFEGGRNGSVVCNTLPVVPNATLTNVTSDPLQGQLRPGTRATYACDYGYYFSKEVAEWTIECKSCGWWSSIPPCTAVDCLTPPEVPFAAASFESTTFGAVVAYTCNVGYRLLPPNSSDDTRLMQCDAFGSWTNSSEIVCVVHCEDPPTLLRSTVYWNSTMVGAEALYTCDTGFVFNGRNGERRYMLCDDSGNWTADTDFYCEHCGAPPRLAHATVMNGSTTYLEAAAYSCEEGYRFGGTADPQHVVTFICDGQGEWIGANISCEGGA